MKKMLFIPVVICAINLMEMRYAAAQTFDEGTLIFQAGYGFPNLFTNILKNNYATSGLSGDVKSSGFGPAAVKFEYGVTEHWGIGFMFTYANSNITFQETGFDENGNEQLYNYDLKAPRVGALARLNYHFGNIEKFDPYVGFALGYKSFKLSYVTDDPYYEDELTSISNPIPIGIRINLGASYFFTDNIGVYGEVGLGGAILEGGISIRIPQ